KSFNRYVLRKRVFSQTTYIPLDVPPSDGAAHPAAVPSFPGHAAQTGLAVWSLHVLPVFTRGFLHIEPQHKNMQTEKDRSPVLSLTMIGLNTWPGSRRYKLPTAPGGSLRKDGPGWGKKQKIYSPRPQAYLRVCVRVCVLFRLHICACVFQCVVYDRKS